MGRGTDAADAWYVVPLANRTVTLPVESYSVRSTVGYQRGTATYTSTTATGDITISAVTVARATAICNNRRYSAAVAEEIGAHTAILNSTTTVRLERGTTTSTAVTITGAAEVQENV